jgi:hypothetical protein
LRQGVSMEPHVQAAASELIPRSRGRYGRWWCYGRAALRERQAPPAPSCFLVLRAVFGPFPAWLRASLAPSPCFYFCFWLLWLALALAALGASGGGLSSILIIKLAFVSRYLGPPAENTYRNGRGERPGVRSWCPSDGIATRSDVRKSFGGPQS